jgi:hypothetical protein
VTKKCRKCRKNWRFAQTAASFCKNMIITLVFEKKTPIFSRKLAKIVENCDHNIDHRQVAISQSFSKL